MRVPFALVRMFYECGFDRERSRIFNSKAKKIARYVSAPAGNGVISGDSSNFRRATFQENLFEPDIPNAADRQYRPEKDTLQKHPDL